MKRIANGVLGQLCRNVQYRDKKVYLDLYKRHVRCHLEYCSPAWNPWLQKDIDVLEKVQERAVKQIRGLQSSTYTERLKELNLPSLKHRRYRADMIETFKIIQGYNKSTVPLGSPWQQEMEFKQETRVIQIICQPNNQEQISENISLVIGLFLSGMHYLTT